jgi:flagellar biosynthesis protein FlhF
MQVKKFEARSMKEALDMIKGEFGPEAIILGAKDNSQRYGLVGEGSVEVTAAIAENSLQKKKFAESRMPEKLKQDFVKSPAKAQKEWVEKLLQSYRQEIRKDQGQNQNHNQNQNRNSKGNGNSNLGVSRDQHSLDLKRAIQERRYVDITDDWYPEEIKSTQNKTSSDHESQSSQTHYREVSNPVVTPNHRVYAKDTKDTKDTVDRKDTNGSRQGAVSSKQGLRSHEIEVTNFESQRNAVSRLEEEIQELKNLLKTIQEGEKTGSQNPLNLPLDLVLIFDRLKKSGLREEFALNLLDQAKKNMEGHRYQNPSFVEGWLVQWVLDKVLIQEPTKKVQLFLGPSGSGKTTLLVKWATHLKIKKQKKVAILTADQGKQASVQQLRIYAQILNTPFVVLSQKSDWDYVLEELKDYDCIMCDYPGSNLQKEEELLRIQSLLPSSSIDCERHLVFNSSLDRRDMSQLYLGYKPFHPTTFSFTRLDETKQKGFLFEISFLHKTPLFAFSLGPKIPEDFELATPERVADFVLSLSHFGGLDAFR